MIVEFFSYYYYPTPAKFLDFWADLRPFDRTLAFFCLEAPSPAATSHPLAPEEIKSKFSDFLKLQKNPQPVHSSSSSSTQASQSKERVLWYDDPSELPWNYKTPSSSEIELVNVSADNTLHNSPSLQFIKLTLPLH
jgi:hypothetical protein